MYAWVNAKKGSGIYRSDDGGESWQQVNDEERVWGEAMILAACASIRETKT